MDGPNMNDFSQNASKADPPPEAEQPKPLVQLTLQDREWGFRGGQPFALPLYRPLTVILGPNGTGKTRLLRLLAVQLRNDANPALGSPQGKGVVFLAAGRAAPFEDFRSFVRNPGSGIPPAEGASIGSEGYVSSALGFESLTGPFLRLQARPDLALKVRARLQAHFGLSLSLKWANSGLRPRFLRGPTAYDANTEASGILHLIGLLAAIHDPDIAALLIDEPEVSLHPQLQTFLIEEMLSVAGDPREPGKKLIVLATHSEHFFRLDTPEDLCALVLLGPPETAPHHIAPYDDALKWRDLPKRLSEFQRRYRSALFATTVLLVEGESDELIVRALARRFRIALAATGVEIIAAGGAQGFASLHKLFRLLGKRIVILADLDALADDNTLVTLIDGDEAAQSAARDRANADRPVKAYRAFANDLGAFADRRRHDLDALVPQTPWACTGPRESVAADNDADIRRRRAAWWCAANRPSDGGDALWADLATRFGGRLASLLEVLAAGGMFVLLAGTIEACFGTRQSVADARNDKLAAARAEIEDWASEPDEALAERYADVLRALRAAAKVPPVDENALLRELIGAALGAIFPNLTEATKDDEIEQILQANQPAAADMLDIKNKSSPGTRAVAVTIKSPLFPRKDFPPILTEEEWRLRRDELLPPPSSVDAARKGIG